MFASRHLGWLPSAEGWLIWKDVIRAGRHRQIVCQHGQTNHLVDVDWQHSHSFGKFTKIYSHHFVAIQIRIHPQVFVQVVSSHDEVDHYLSQICRISVRYSRKRIQRNNHCFEARVLNQTPLFVCLFVCSYVPMIALLSANCIHNPVCWNNLIIKLWNLGHCWFLYSRAQIHLLINDLFHKVGIGQYHSTCSSMTAPKYTKEGSGLDALDSGTNWLALTSIT